MRHTFIAAALCVWIVGCASPLGQQIVGEWSGTNLPWTIVLSDNGQMSMQTIGPPASGTYVLEGSNLKIVLNDGQRFQASIQVSGDEMTLTDPDGSKSMFRRVRR
jgi:hypothetical protein